MTDALDPSVPIDFNQARAAAEEARAQAPEEPSKTRTITVARKTFPIVVKVPVVVQGEIEDAMNSGDIKTIAGGVAKYVAKPFREQFVEYVLANPEDEGNELTDEDIVDVTDLIDAFNKAQEMTTQRPSTR